MGYDEPMKASEKVTALLNDRLELFTDDFMQTGMTYKAKEVLRTVFLMYQLDSYSMSHTVRVIQYESYSIMKLKIMFEKSQKISKDNA